MTIESVAAVSELLATVDKVDSQSQIASWGDGGCRELSGLSRA
jgi:hypothetical protein